MSNEIKDLSGASTPNSQNPFDALIIEANHDPVISSSRPLSIPYSNMYC